MAAHRQLREGDAIIASLAPETGVARYLARLHAAEERLEGQINADGNVLQYLRLHAGQRGALSFQGRQQRVLVKQPHGLLPLFPRRLALFEQTVIEPAALLKLVFEEAALLVRGIQTVLERLTHAG